MQDQVNEDCASRTSKQKNSITGVLIWTVLAVAVGSGFQHGYNTGVLNAPQKVIESWINQTTPMSENELTVVWSTATSIMCIGGIIGGALTGVLSTNVGRRMALILNNGIAIVAGLTMGGSKYVGQPWMIILGRFIIGINAGLNNGVGPMYLSEISPTGLRGSITAVYQLNMTTFILLSQIAGTDRVLGTDNLWPYLFFLVLIPAVYQILALILSPESPKYLLEINNEQKAIEASNKLSGKQEGMKNIEQIKTEIAAARTQPKVALKDMWTVNKYRKPLIILCVLMAAQQLSGVNAEDMGPSVFIIFIVCNALATLFLVINIPETKINRSMK
uniref:Solute carrier family 2, facilitated glucose transporter member 1 n=1 Tax=Lygus hesperus TaxID=30085 RepID=A0A0A9Z9A1_LYGHE